MRRTLVACVAMVALSAPVFGGSPDDARRFETALAGGDAARSTGQWTTAIQCYREALALEPDHAQARFHLAMAYREVHRYYEARRNFRLALNSRANDRAWVSQCRLQMAACWEASGSYREALAEYRLALAADADSEQARSGQKRALAQINGAPEGSR